MKIIQDGITVQDYIPILAKQEKSLNLIREPAGQCNKIWWKLHVPRDAWRKMEWGKELTFK